MATKPELPIPISVINGRYLLFDINAVSYLRREHQICGVLIGSIPQSPSQNVFLGLPLELMPEEAKLLVEKQVAYLVDDVRAHEQMLHEIDVAKRERYLTAVKEDGQKASKVQSVKREQMKRRALREQSSSSSTPSSDTTITAEEVHQGANEPLPPTEDGLSLFSMDKTRPAAAPKHSDHITYAVTPPTSQMLLLPTPPTTPTTLQVQVPSSYPLFKHLHDRGYFLSPGLRFGCQYMAYPGDPLRYHSHFLVVGAGWDEEIDLMDIVGGGRLGTGVKKGYLLGGADAAGQVQTFSVEWAGM